MTPPPWKKRATRSRHATPKSSAFEPSTAIMTSQLPKNSVAETLADKIVALKVETLPAATRRKCEDLLIDVVGLCVTARNEDYVGSALAGWDDDGPCTAIGHKRTLNASGAALVNGTAAHGEDFDDTFEGGPVHAGAVVVPAVLAACERHNPDGRMALIGIAVGTEVLCRLSLVVPKAVHKAGFHPTAIFGAMGAAAGVGAALRLHAKTLRETLRRRARPQRQTDCGRARHRREHGGRHHRISCRGRMDQAAACGLGGAVRHSGGTAAAGGGCRAADCLDGHRAAVL